MAKQWYVYNKIGSHLRKMEIRTEKITQAEAFIKWWESSLELIDKLK